MNYKQVINPRTGKFNLVPKQVINPTTVHIPSSDEGRFELNPKAYNIVKFEEPVSPLMFDIPIPKQGDEPPHGYTFEFDCAARVGIDPFELEMQFNYPESEQECAQVYLDAERCIIKFVYSEISGKYDPIISKIPFLK